MKANRGMLLCLFVFVALVGFANVGCAPCGGAPVFFSNAVCPILKDKSGKNIKPDKLIVISVEGNQAEHQNTWDSASNNCIDIGGATKVDVKVEWEGEVLMKTVEIKSPRTCQADTVDVTFSFSK